MPEERVAEVTLTLRFHLPFELDSDDPAIAKDYPAGMGAEEAVETLMGEPGCITGYDLGWLGEDTTADMSAVWVDDKDGES